MLRAGGRWNHPDASWVAASGKVKPLTTVLKINLYRDRHYTRNPNRGTRTIVNLGNMYFEGKHNVYQGICLEASLNLNVDSGSYFLWPLVFPESSQDAHKSSPCIHTCALGELSFSKQLACCMQYSLLQYPLGCCAGHCMIMKGKNKSSRISGAAHRAACLQVPQTAVVRRSKTVFGKPLQILQSLLNRSMRTYADLEKTWRTL